MLTERPLRWAIVGTSYISGVMVDAIRKSNGGFVYCVAARTAETLAKFAEKFDIKKTYLDYDQITNDPEVDIVYIGLPTPLHGEWVKKFAVAGKHVLNEKSFDVNARVTIEALEVVRKQNVFCMEAQMYRCHPIIERLKAVVTSEKPVGEILSIRAKFTSNIINRINRSAGGGILSLGCYPMSLVRLLCGDPISVEGTAVLIPPSQEGHSVFDSRATARVQLPNNIYADIVVSIDEAHEWEFDVQCERGVISLTDLWDSKINDEIIITSNSLPVEIDRIEMNQEVNFYVLQINTVQDCVRRGATEAVLPAMTWQDSIDNMKALDMWRNAIQLHYPMDDNDDAVNK